MLGTRASQRQTYQSPCAGDQDQQHGTTRAAPHDLAAQRVENSATYHLTPWHLGPGIWVAAVSQVVRQGHPS